jgi:hypothetical protein
MNDKYTIGDIVRRHGFGEGTWCVIATRQQPLNLAYLASLREDGVEPKIEGLETFARIGICVDSDMSNGMHYIVKKILKTMENGFYKLDEKNVYCFEGDLFQ